MTTVLVQVSYLRKSRCLQTSGTPQKLSPCLLSSNGTHTQVLLALISRAWSKTRLSGFRPLSHNIKCQSHHKTPLSYTNISPAYHYIYKECDLLCRLTFAKLQHYQKKLQLQTTHVFRFKNRQLGQCNNSINSRRYLK